MHSKNISQLQEQRPDWQVKKPFITLLCSITLGYLFIPNVNFYVCVKDFTQEKNTMEMHKQLPSLVHIKACVDQ